MTSDTAKGLLDFLLPQLQDEAGTTRKVLAAIPAASGGYKPSDRCMSGLELANHIAGSETFFLNGVLNGAFEWKQLELKTPGDVVAYFDQNVPGLIGRLSGMSGEQLAKEITFGPWTQPAVTYLNLHMKHTIHHRGQLSAYLRPMGGKVPSIYGPSADDKGGA